MPTLEPAGTPRAGELFSPELRSLTIGLVSTITVVALELLAIGTVMPKVADELGQLELYGWVFSGFFLGTLVGTVVAGGALDRMPLPRPFAVGLGLFALGLAIGGLAPSMPVLVVARVIQGLGGGAVAPTAYVAIGRGLPQRLQPQMFALMSAAWVLPGVIGPSIAAIVGELTTWRLVFLGLLPLLAIAGAVALSALRNVPAVAPEAEHAAAAATVRHLPNALLAAVGAGTLVAALTVEALPVAIAGSLAGGAALLIAFRRLTPAGTLALAVGVPAAVLLRGVMTFAFFSGDAYIPLLLQTWRGTPATLTGIVFTVTTIAWSSATWIQARRIDRVGPRRFVALGFACLAMGAALTVPAVMSTVRPEIVIATWVLAGAGMGFMYSAVTLVVLRGVPPAQQGSASSALQLSDILGTALGAGLGGALTAVGERSGGDGLGWAIAGVFALSLGASLFGLAASGRIVGPPDDRRRSGSGVGAGEARERATQGSSVDRNPRTAAVD